MNYKKTINVILRCGIYAYIVSRIFHLSTNFNIFASITFLSIMLNLALCDLLPIHPSMPEDELLNLMGNLFMYLNLFFYTYFYAKICGVYKFLKNYKLYQKFLIIIATSILTFIIGIFDFKNFEIFKEIFTKNEHTVIIFCMLFIIPAFLLNLFFDFLTKKFPKPFERIGYYCSIEFFKDIFKRKKQRIN